MLKKFNILFKEIYDIFLSYGKFYVKISIYGNFTINFLIKEISQSIINFYKTYNKMLYP